MRQAWENGISSWHKNQSRIRFTFKSNSNSFLNTMNETSTSLYGRAYWWFDIFKHITKFEAYLNVGNRNVNLRTGQSTAVHELGHVMGLAHNNGVSIMNMKRNRTTMITPQRDDINGINALYPIS